MIKEEGFAELVRHQFRLHRCTRFRGIAKVTAALLPTVSGRNIVMSGGKDVPSLCAGQPVAAENAYG